MYATVTYKTLFQNIQQPELVPRSSYVSLSLSTTQEIISVLSHNSEIEIEIMIVFPMNYRFFNVLYRAKTIMDFFVVFFSLLYETNKRTSNNY